MLPRAKRLSRSDFGTAANGKRAVSAHFSVTVSLSSEGRAAAVVSKKVAKRSVDRHMLKRRMIAAAEPFVKPGRSFILYARAGSLTLSYTNLAREIQGLLTSGQKV